MTKKIVAGEVLYQQIQDFKELEVTKKFGYYESESLSKFQRKMDRLGITGAQIVKSNYGYSVRYDSGLRDWGLIASSKSGQLDGSIEDAIRFCKEWVSRDLTCRYAWISETEGELS